MDEAIIVHRISEFVEPGGRFIVVDEGVEEAALVEFPVFHGAEGVQVRWAASMDFAAHAEGFAKVDGFHEWRDPSDVADAGA